MDEQNIPIDINTSKLLDWLINRRHVNKDWQSKVLIVREKINNAIQDMPEHEDIIKLLSGQHINYFHCLKLIEILKETEADTKKLFGRYGSQRMKDWQDITQSYRQNNLYLAESAQLLIRTVNYEIPSMKRQVTKFEQLQSDSERKLKDYSKIQTQVMNEFHSSCSQLGIAGISIKNELLQLLDQLPAIYENVARNTKNIKNALEFYSSFVSFHSDKTCDISVLPLIKYLIENGNTTMYEYIYGKKPQSIVPPSSNNSENKDNIKEYDGISVDENCGSIDFDDIETNTSTDNFYDDPVQDEIDWGSLNTEEGFEIIEHQDFDGNLDGSGILDQKSDNIAYGADTLTILDNPVTRDQILDELMEVEAFLKMRYIEMSTESDMLTVSQMQITPTMLQIQTPESVATMTEHVHSAINELTNKRAQHLHNIKHSPKYVDILSASLRQKVAVSERMKHLKVLIANKVEDAGLQVKIIKPAIDVIIENVKTLQKQIENDISQKYNGRPVNIVGGINLL